MARPNFFIIGAPKCGTTALSDYLRTHPNIYFSEPKEPHYFAQDFEKYRNIKTLKEYLSLFEKSTSNHIAIGEGSVFYLFSSVALKKIYEFDSQAKIIVMLRNPVDLVYSFHSQLLYSADESEKNFEKAWRLQHIRQQGKKVPHQCREAPLLQYAAIGKLGEQVEKLFTVFPPEQIKIIWFEDFVKSTKDVYDDVINFLKVPNYNRTDFTKINENKTHKLRIMGSFSEKTPKFLSNIVLKTKDILGIERLYIMDTIRTLNTKITSREPLSNKFRAELIEEFTDDIKKLSQILDRDLNHWLVKPPLNS